MRYDARHRFTALRSAFGFCLVALALTSCFALCSCTDDAEAPAVEAVQEQPQPEIEPEIDEVAEAPDGTPEEPVAEADDMALLANVPDGSFFEVTYLDVGQGDAAVLNCDGHWMLIDGGPPDASSLLYSFCTRNSVERFDYVVATHPDTDHTGGIPGALQAAKTARAFCSETEATQKSFQSMVERLNGMGTSLEVPALGDVWDFGSARVEVIGPTARTDDGDANNDSIMLKITYGTTVFVFTGDADPDEERGAASSLDGCDVLKVSHHGSDNASCYAFLRAALPTYAVISCGASNTYGHPTEGALSRLRDCGAKVFRTDMQGDIVAVSDGTSVTVTPSRNADADTLVPGGSGASTLSASEAPETASTPADSGSYIGNVNSKKFHRPDCKTLPAEKNRVYFSSREEAVASGYEPCKNCKP